MEDSTITLYDSFVVSRGKPKHISTLGKQSDKKIRIKCPGCGNIHHRYMKVLAAQGNFECKQCSAVTKAKANKPLIGTTNNRLTLKAYTSSIKYGLFSCSCGNEKEILYSTFIYGSSKSCGCLDIERKAASKLAGNSSELNRIRSSKAYKVWKLNVLERDSYTCNKCYTAGGKLAVHHILPFAENKGVRFDVDNGLVLCVDCHIEYHKQYGITDEVNECTMAEFLSKTSK